MQHGWRSSTIPYACAEAKMYMQKGTWSSYKLIIHTVEPMWTYRYKHGLIDVILDIILC